MSSSNDDKKFKETVERLLKTPPKPHKPTKDKGSSEKAPRKPQKKR